MKILIIDDNVVTRSMLRIKFKSELPHAIINTASSLELGIAEIESGNYDYIVSDLRLHDSDGENTINVLSKIVPREKIQFMSSAFCPNIPNFTSKDGDYAKALLSGVAACQI